MRWYATLVLSLLGGFAGAALFSFTPFGGEATRSYLMANPEVLPRAMEVLNQRERQARIDPVRDQLELAFPGAVLGSGQSHACGIGALGPEDRKFLDHDPEIGVRGDQLLHVGHAAAAVTAGIVRELDER